MAAMLTKAALLCARERSRSVGAQAEADEPNVQWNPVAAAWPKQRLRDQDKQRGKACSGQRNIGYFRAAPCAKHAEHAAWAKASHLSTNAKRRNGVAPSRHNTVSKGDIKGGRQFGATRRAA